ncbi:hypothetical protein GGTG_03511 [Gaeumannomyces tritici R3-111a-1]|uniref:Uncharacterized protein n=1 Tax=Gaeumannomyces tritici (strain R3-111a-1) TaxID=644352 RepID=J3NQF4_GAET3|nr:hypothetical protein GGTG_03511 [Gaeumannomyces tritici R3-111a-1]EJT78410.1 hypothetical protein GGTG_03511 [Gaeumannomyces tritici R3-111a-1]
MPRPPLRARARPQPPAKPSASRGPARRRPPTSPPPPPPPPAAPSPAADDGDNTISDVSADADADAAGLPDLPLFNTTFHTYRASPLHVGPQPLTADRLARVAASLRDALVGDVVRGVQDDDDDDDGDGGRQRRGLLLTLRYEAGRCEALFLPPATAAADDDDGNDDPSSSSPPGFLRLPLVLVRMPPALRAAVLGFLAREFDCRFSPLALPGPVLLAAWEGWVRDVGLGGDDEAVAAAAAAASPALRKDVILTLAFHLPSPATGGGGPDAEKQEQQQGAPGLRSLDLTLPATDVARFVASGKDVLEEEEEEEEEKSGQGAPTPGPFTAALARYLGHHLALDVHHGAVQVVRVSCGAFVLSEGRLKLFRPAAGGGTEEEEGGGGGRSREAEALRNLLLRLCARHSVVDAT